MGRSRRSARARQSSYSGETATIWSPSSLSLTRTRPSGVSILFDAAAGFEPLGAVHAHAEGGALAHDERGEAGGIGGLRQDRETRGGAVLLHLDRLVGDVERVRCEQPLHQPAQRLAGHIVDVGLQHHDLVTLESRAGILPERPRWFPDEQTQAVGPGEAALAEAVADRAQRHWRLAGAGKGGEHRSTGGRHQLGAHLSRRMVQLDAGVDEQRQGGRRRDGHAPMLGLHEATGGDGTDEQ